MRFQQYELVRELGRGATARVHLAHDATGAPYCLKIFHPRLFGDSRFAFRIEREMEVSAQLQHPSIVRVHRILKDSDPPAIVMDFVDGENLERFQRRLPYVLPEISVLVLLPILEALEHAHGQGVIHRDLKPENVLVSREGQVIVTDFGLAKVRDSATTTQSNVILGTLDYLSPEQARGDLVTPQSDLFSVGSILYFLTTGTRPFSRTTPLGTLAAIQNDAPEPPQRRNPKLSGPLCRILLRAMAKQPAERFATAREFRLALVAYLDGLGIHGEAFSLGQWMREPADVTLEVLKVCAESLTLACERSLAARRRDEFLETLAHLSLKAPESPALGRLTGSYRAVRRSRSGGWFAAAGILLVLLALGAWRWTRPPGTRAVAAPAAIAEPPAAHPPPPSGTSRVAATPPPVTKHTAVRASSRGTVIFDLDPDVTVYWNGRKVDPSRPLRDQPIGPHVVLLDRPGFDPIRARVMVKANEPTVIRVKENEGETGGAGR